MGLKPNKRCVLVVAGGCVRRVCVGLFVLISVPSWDGKKRRRTNAYATYAITCDSRRAMPEIKPDISLVSDRTVAPQQVSEVNNLWSYGKM